MPVVANPAALLARSWSAVIFQRLVLGCVPRCAARRRGNVGGAVSAGIWADTVDPAFGILHKLRAGMREDRIGGRAKEQVQGRSGVLVACGKTCGQGRGRPPQDAGRRCCRGSPAKTGHGARQAEGWPRRPVAATSAIAVDRSATSRGFVEKAVTPGSMIVAASGSEWGDGAAYASEVIHHHAIAESGYLDIGQEFMP